MNTVRTRIAPSPTGYPHIGTIYQALFDFVFAKKNNGQFIVRIEDTDQKRFVKEAEEVIFKAFDWFGLREDESPRKGGVYGPYRQSERLDIYKKYALELVEKGRAYYCFCSKERLEEVRKKMQSEKKPPMYDKYCLKLSHAEIERKLQEENIWVIRLKVPENEKVIVRDEIRGDIVFDSNIIDDQVLLKSDGFPTYHLAVVVDDHLMKITHVVRGEEWISSLPKHILLYRFFGWETPLFFHTPLLRNTDKSKLSKRHGHTDVRWYQNEGFLPEAILNFLALMGWSHPYDKEIFTLEEFIKEFDLKDLKPAGPIFDLEKLKWMNGEYIRQLSIDELSSKLKVQSENLTKEQMDKIIPIVQTRMQILNDFSVLVAPFFENQVHDLTREEKEKGKKLFGILSQIKDWNTETILSGLKIFLTETEVKMPFVYRILIGEKQGLPLSEMLELIGKEKTLSKIEESIR